MEHGIRTTTIGPSPMPAVAAAIVAAGTAIVLAPIDPQPIRDLNTPPPAPVVEPEPEPAVVANYDCYGGLWGHDTVTEAEAHFAKTHAEGGTVEEWNVTDRAGRPLRIVRTTEVDTAFLGGIDISVMPVAAVAA